MIAWALLLQLCLASDQNLPRTEVKVGPPVGLLNVGNTCFLNAVLQSLYAHPLFRQTLMDCPAVETAQLEREVSRESSQMLVNSLQAVFARMTVAAPKEVVNIEPDLLHNLRQMEAIQGDSGQEGPLKGFDAQEIYSMILGRLPKHLRELFQFAKMETAERGDRLNWVMSVPLAVQSGAGVVELGGRRLAQNTLEAILSETRIKTLPPILTVCLNRAHSYQSRRKWLTEMQKDAIRYPMAFEMQGADADKLGGHVRYRLNSVIVHTGGYHYLAYVRRNLNWYCANDSQVRMASEEEILGERGRWVALIYDRTGFTPAHLYLDTHLYEAARSLDEGFETIKESNKKSRMTNPLFISAKKH